MRDSATPFAHAPGCATNLHVINPRSEDNGPCFTSFIEAGNNDASAWINFGDDGPRVILYATPPDGGLAPAEFERFCTDGLKMLGKIPTIDLDAMFVVAGVTA